MEDREFEKLLELLQDMNRNLEKGLDKIAEEVKELRN